MRYGRKNTMASYDPSAPKSLHSRPAAPSQVTNSSQVVNVHINPKMLTSNKHGSNKNETAAGNMYINPGFISNTDSLASQIKSVDPQMNSTSSQFSRVKPHINPNFVNMNKNSSAGNILDASASVKRSVHVNPNFVGRRLPSPPVSRASCSRLPESIRKEEIIQNNIELSSTSKPHINPKFVNASKTKEYNDAIKQVVKQNDHLNENIPVGLQGVKMNKLSNPSTSDIKANVYINPKFTHDINSYSKMKSENEEIYQVIDNSKNIDNQNLTKRESEQNTAFENKSGKENQYSSTYESSKAQTTKINSGTINHSNKKTLFKKIGTRKIVRMNGASPPFKSNHKTKAIISQNSSQSRECASLKTPTATENKQSKIYTRSTESAFKKIGKRKLIRKVSPSSKSFSASTKKSVSSHKYPSSAQVYTVKTNTKIVKESSTPVTSLKNNTPMKQLINRRFVFSTPIGKKLKRQKLSSAGRKSIISESPLKTPRLNTPVGIFKRKQKTPFSLIRNPFRVDRRKNNLKRRLSMTSTNNPSNNVTYTQSPGAKIKRFKVNSKSINKQITAIHLPSDPKSTKTEENKGASTQKDKLMQPPVKPLRKVNNSNQVPSKRTAYSNTGKYNQAATLIQVNGVRYSVSENGHKLKRLPPKEPSEDGNADEDKQSSKINLCNKQLPPAVSIEPKKDESSVEEKAKSVPKKKFYLEGEEYVEDEPGILIRSRNSMTRASITNYKSRSINTILKSQTRAKQYCMFYNKFGKCNKRDKGVCPYIHDPEKVAVCRKFLHGNCYKEDCLLSHKVAPEKMPSCKFFLEGLCTKENCPYRHIKVSENAVICEDYRKGYCPNGSECKKKHEDYSKPKVNSSSLKTNQDQGSSISKSTKRIPPVKPKRKSLGPTTVKETIESIKPPQRYFQGENESIKADEDNRSRNNQMNIDNGNSKSQQKEEINLSLAVREESIQEPNDLKNSHSRNILQSPNDSGPYEEIDEDINTNSNMHDTDQDDTETHRRPPLGRLPSYISLTSFKDDINDHEPKDRICQSDQHHEIEETGGEQNISTEEYEERLI